MKIRKIRNVVIVMALLMASALVSQAQTTLTAWNFDNLSIGPNLSPAPSTGLGTATPLGMANTSSADNSGILSLGGSSASYTNSWQVQGRAASGTGTGWSTNAPIGTQGAEFDGSTFGYYQIKVSFDVYATTNAEANLQVQYTTDGSTWSNATITSAGTSAVLATNTDSTNTVVGTYVKLAGGWNNQITVDFTGFSGVDNDANFGIRLVNASTGPDCVNTTNAIYNNTSGSWTFDNVVIQGRSIDTIADWTFDNTNYYDGDVVSNPVPVIGYGLAQGIGMDNDYTFAGGVTGSTNYDDVIYDGTSSTGTNGPLIWRVRGTPKPHNGWNTEAPIGTQGAEYDVDTSGYSNIVCSFDLYFTSKAEAKMCVLYTTNGWVSTNVAQTLFNGSWPQFMTNNLVSSLGYSPNTVTGTYFYNTYGQGFYDNFVVDFTGIPGVGNNPKFGFRVVNAASGSDCVAYNGGSYNNQSGNWRWDNVVVGGTAGNVPPQVTYAPDATVDGPFTNTFIDDPNWRTNIAAIYVNGVQLGTSAYNITTPGQIVFTPADSPLLQKSGLKELVIIAKDYGTARVTQPLYAGVATQLTIMTEPAAPSASGGTLTANPVLGVLDQYGNGTTNPDVNVSVVASASGSSGWTLGGATTQTAVNGIMAFTNLTASVDGTSAVSNAVITFHITGYPVSVTNSVAFNIGPPPTGSFTPGDLAVLQVDRVANNTTFSIIELKSSVAGQTAPANIVPISATGTNALRLSSSGSCGRLSLSDDGTLVCFAAFRDGSAATPDETHNYDRAGAGLNYTNGLVMGLRYLSTSYNGSEARSAVQLSDGSWVVDDKGGLYEGTTNNGILANPNLNDYNNVCVRSFGGNLYVETQKSQNGEILPAVFEIQNGATVANNLGTEPEASDFYLVSTNGGASYDILYVLAANSSTEGVIKKYSWEAGVDPINNYGWAETGSYTNATGGNCLFATTNGNGGVYLYLTTAESSNNSLIRLTDASGWGAPMNIVSSSVLYTAPGDTYLDGVTFVPQQTANAAEPTPPPVLTAQNGAIANSPFSVTLAPDDPTWRSAITSITVNGSPLPSAAYDATQAGEIVFNPSQSSLLQGSAAKEITITATGYSDDSVVQNVTVEQPVLGGVSFSGGHMSFSFTNAPGLSFSVLGTNNLSAPVDTWPVVGTTVENPSGSGHYQFTDPNPATNAAEFYILRQP